MILTLTDDDGTVLDSVDVTVADWRTMAVPFNAHELLASLNPGPLDAIELAELAPCGCPHRIIRDEGHQEGCRELANAKEND